MISTLVVSLWLTVKEGLAVGFALSILKTICDLGNPNLAVCGRVSGNSFRDFRNFPRAELLPHTVGSYSRMHHIQHTGGHICIGMDQAVSIVEGGDDSEAWAGVQDLVERVHQRQEIRSASGNISTWGIE